jgi:hypothetical protein
MHPCKLKILHQKLNKKSILNLSDASTEDMDEVPNTTPQQKQAKKTLKHCLTTQATYAPAILQPKRTHCINWLLHFSANSQINDATSMLAIRILDAYTTIMRTPCLKIAMIAALTIACKLVESPLIVSHMLFLCELNEEISSSSVFLIEKDILTVLRYKALLPTELDFCSAYAIILNFPALISELSYKCKLHAHSVVLSGMLPSLIAACSVYEHFPDSNSNAVCNISRYSKAQIVEASAIISYEMNKLLL